MSSNNDTNRLTAPLSSPGSFPDLMTEQELIQFLRIPEVSKAQDYSNVIENLVRMHDLPRILICKKRLLDAVPTQAYRRNQGKAGNGL